MPAKERAPRHDQVAPKRPSPEPALEDQDLLLRQEAHAAASLQRAGERASTFSPRDVLQLQRAVGNRGVRQFLARTGADDSKPAVAGAGRVRAPAEGAAPGVGSLSRLGPGPLVQRRVALTKQSEEDPPDFVEMTSINYALKEAGGPVELLKDSDMSGMGPEDVLFLVGHGGRGSSGDYLAQEIVQFLLAEDKGLKQPIRAIKFTSCYAGAGKSDDRTDSVVATIKTALDNKDWKGVEVTGARGPSIKSTKLGKEFTVVPRKGELGYGTVGKIQQALEAKHDVRDEVGRRIRRAEQVNKRLLSLREKAEIASDTSGPFFKEFVEILNNPKATLDKLRKKPEEDLEEGEKDLLAALVEWEEAGQTSLKLADPMLEMKSTGKKPPPETKSLFSGWCFITSACVEARGLPDDCHELQTLRAFRDGYLSALPGGPALVAQYYELAPRIVARIKARPDAQEVLAGLYDRIARIVECIAAGKYPEAIRRYRRMVSGLQARYLS